MNSSFSAPRYWSIEKSLMKSGNTCNLINVRGSNISRIHRDPLVISPIFLKSGFDKIFFCEKVVTVVMGVTDNVASIF